MSNKEDTLFNPKAWKAVVLAILVVFVIGLLLSWQYEKLTKESEERMTSLEDVIAGTLAQDVLDNFMMARISKDESQANIYLTERAMEQKETGTFLLVDDFESYIVLKKERITDDTFKFTVKLYSQGKADSIVEIISLSELLDTYYIDSVEIAG